MLRRGSLSHAALFTLTCLACLPLAPSLALAREPAGTPSAVDTYQVMKVDPAVALQIAMRKLWEDHITFTRNYIISALADLGDVDAVARRLLRNQDDIGDAIKPYYGNEAGKRLSSLLREHISIATEVVKAAKADERRQLTEAQKKWTMNGKEIAAFLSDANKNWARKDLEDMMQKHLDLTSGEVVSRLNKDWASDIKSYDDGHLHMLMFADRLSDGIAKQFPEKFTVMPVGTRSK